MSHRRAGTTAAPAIRTLSVPSAAVHPGPTYVLLHGVGLSHRSFTRLARILSLSGRVVSFDLPGFGPTPKPDRPWSVEDYAAVVRAELARLQTGPAVVVGHSMGAQFAIELARHDPDAVSHLVLVGPVVNAAKRTLREQTVGLLRDSALEPPDTQAMVAIDYLRCGMPWFLTEAAAMRDYPTESAIAGVRHPVLVVRGENDPIADADWCASLARRAPDGRVATIPGSRHNVVHSNAAAVADAIRAFVVTPR
ncbi:pimeloyl-ACP methyl ester carboxylesterase [Conyzicola lurida]|uniref:Pimeloyl-ACP methyl ester carboxylesterase n=1 Tax=Conyzicola lurida TaxID=1172621 RepID=A0A841ARG1_9MICO|nr:pimeloyl-ACP methyl ester carboxylesterase [Conyzicola lurida]